MIFEYQAEGKQPERFAVDLRNGLVRFTVRGEPHISSINDPLTGWHQTAAPGPTAIMTMPVHEVLKMVVQMLKVPPTSEMCGKVPFVCWFDDTAQRDAFVEACRRANPDMGDVDLSFFPT